MAIAAQNLAPAPTGSPSLSPASGGVMGPGDWQEPFVVGTASIPGDGATLAAVVNWIDGTATLPFTPSSVIVFAAKPAAVNPDTLGVLQVEGSAVAPRVTAITTTSFTVNFTTAPANAKFFNILIVAYK
jgi:hypothetical protein